MPSCMLALERVKSSGVRQSKITKGVVWAGLGGKGFRKRDRYVCPVVCWL